MKNLSLATVNSINSFSPDDAWVIALKIHVRSNISGEIVSEIRVSNDTQKLTILGEVYEPMAFDIEFKSAQNELPSMDVTLQDQGEIVGPFMLRYGGAVGSEVDVMIVRATIETETTPTVTYTEPELIEFFTVLESGYKDLVASWKCGTENPLRKMFPMRKQDDDQCSFRYKDPGTCGYAGNMPSCDLSLDGPNGCRAHNNVANNGSFPGIIVRSS